MFHIDPKTGDVINCTITECPRGTHFEHSESARAHFEAMMTDFLFTTFRKGDHAPAPTLAARENLNAEFALFPSTPAARAQVLDRGNWRGDQAADARTNGDFYADAHAKTKVSGYYDATPDEDLFLFEPI